MTAAVEQPVGTRASFDFADRPAGWWGAIAAAWAALAALRYADGGATVSFWANAIMAALMLVVAVRGYKRKRGRIILDERGVTVTARSAGLSRRFRWREIERFQFHSAPDPNDRFVFPILAAQAERRRRRSLLGGDLSIPIPDGFTAESWLRRLTAELAFRSRQQHGGTQSIVA